ncbi:MAG: PAS domain-containing sensor histidine kinase [Oculatellaceae cyanobacterium Prado106]|jgi:PAS domain S-box-containing protein|nr:PAS domain-containing sensor histidine kinase [Oculatellaceae cyanobacterium Prado106]
MRQYYWLPSDPLRADPLQVDPLQAEPSTTSPTASPTEPTHEDLEALRRQQKLILNSIGEGVYGVDRQGRVTFVNPAAATMIGWSIEDLVGQVMHSVLHHSKPDGQPYPIYECPIYEAIRDGRVHRTYTEVFWRKDGSSFPVEYISTPIQNEQGELIGAVVTFQDITQRKWAEAVLQRTNEELELKVRDRTEELQQANEQLQELSELKSRFVAMVCHEFRNPLNNILLSASSLQRYDAHLSSDQRLEYIQNVETNVERMTRMIDDILVIGKIEAHRLTLQPAPLELIQFCRSLVAEMQFLAAEHQLSITSRHRQLIAELDEKLLRSILTNLLANSIRYSRPQNQIHLQLLKRNDQVIFRLSDRGIGIPSDDLPHLFDPFYRGKNVSNTPGTGLGLNIVKRFVDLHHGHIQVNSKLNVGTTFTLTFPCQATG